MKDLALNTIKHMPGWEWYISPRGAVHAYNFPYAIAFGKHRKMMQARLMVHPRFEGELNSNIKIRLTTSLSPRQAAIEIQKRLIPKVITHTSQAIAEGKLSLSDVRLED
jgi:hypothetical protein